ncbi:MAG: NTP transferase domain-containing protein, partial [Rhodobacteraceae bacterium]|nr:NTP transferase domain-containing protein [Paracoccaceae bacterium]
MGSAPLPLTILIPAAGAARRMGGRDKLMEPVQGLPILRHVAVLCLTVGCPTWVL